MNRSGKIKILYVLPQLIVGGAEIQVLETIRYLDKSVYDVYVCSLNAGKMTLKDRFTEAGATVIGIHKRSKYDLAVVWRLYRFLRRNRIAIVHTYLNNVWGRLAGILSRTPLILASERSVDSWWKSRFHLFVDSVLERFTDRILVNSNAVRDYYAAHLRYAAPDKIKVIYNGIDVDRFEGGPAPSEAKQRINVDPRDRTVAIFASLKEVKDHRTFLKAAKLVSEATDGVRFLLVGDGPLRQPLEAYADQLGIGGDVSFLGLRDDIPALLAATDLAVLSSVQEGFSNAIIEAMAAGRPVVATNVGGNAEAIVHGATGYIVPPGDERAMAEAMLRILDDDRLMAEFGTKGRQRTVERFRREDRFREIDELYVQALRSKKIIG